MKKTNNLRELIKQKATEMGYYFPGYFRIVINTDHNPECGFNPGDSGVFFHEYIHFLQDIFTTSGVINIVHKTEMIKTISWKINDNRKPLILPYIFNDDEIQEKNNNRYCICVGSTDYDDIENSHISKIEIEKENFNPTIDPDLNNISIIKAITESGKKFWFGSYCIKENLTNLIERKYSDRIENPHLPYNAVEDLCKILYPPIQRNIKLLIDLCDFSLMFPNSGKIMTDILILLAKKYPNSINEINLKTEFENHKIVEDGKNIPHLEYFEKISKLAENNMCEIFYSTHYGSTKDWIRKSIGSARIMRVNNIFSFKDLIEESDKKILDLIENVGIPFLETNKQIFTPNYLDGSLFSLRAMSEVVNVLTYQNIGCQLIKYCKDVFPEIDELKCKETPWEYAKKKDLCPFGQLWKLWRLDSAEKTQRRF